MAGVDCSIRSPMCLLTVPLRLLLLVCVLVNLVLSTGPAAHALAAAKGFEQAHTAPTPPPCHTSTVASVPPLQAGELGSSHHSDGAEQGCCDVETTGCMQACSCHGTSSALLQPPPLMPMTALEPERTVGRWLSSVTPNRNGVPYRPPIG